MAPSSDSINLLEWLRELREVFYLPDYQLIIKGYHSEQADGCTGWDMGKGLQASVPHPGTTLPKSPRVHQPRSSLNPVLLGFHGGFIT